ncbi:MAG: hypothetical protein NZ550_04990 [Fimbriimonadales bacterium]|nr:hypothetical protein [Fimbriimonadales bacterium]MDW8052288.1 hypothetical protein [Armatimonadota bacterium]
MAFRTLSPEKHQNYICLRIIEHGDLEALRWMLRYYGKRRIREWLVARRGLSPRALHFWRLVLNIPKRTVDEWLRTCPEPLWIAHSTKKWSRRRCRVPCVLLRQRSERRAST